MLKASEGINLIRTGCPRLDFSSKDLTRGLLIVSSQVLLALCLLLARTASVITMDQSGETSVAIF